MKSRSLCLLPTACALALSQLSILPADHRSVQRPLSQEVIAPVGPAMPPSDSQTQQSSAKGSVMLSDVMGRDRSMNVFAGFARDILSIANRLDDSAQNSTVLAPLNSAIDNLPRKPWEDPKQYDTLGTNAYEGQDGQDRAHQNIQKFVEAHIVPLSPWPENHKVKPVLDSDKEIWWENKNGAKVLQPDDIEVTSVRSTVGNGEIWIIKGVRNYV